MLKKPLKKNNDTNSIDKILIEEEVEDTVDAIDDFEDIDDEETEQEEYSDDDVYDEEIEEELADNTDEEVADDEDEIDDDDLFTVKKEKRKPIFQEGDYNARLTEVLADRRLTGKYGKPWVNIGFKFKVKNPETGEYIEITFNANKSLDEKSRLYPIVKGILGAEPGDNFNLKQLEGKKAKISIEHSTDSEGNVWDNIVAARKYVSKKK